MDKVKILVDEDNSQILKSAFPLPNLDNVIELSSEVVKEKIQSSVSSILSVIENLEVETKRTKIKEIKFTVAFTAGGEVGLFSVAKGTASGTTGIEFLIEFKP